MEEITKIKLGRAYWLALPVSYMTATGAVSAQWGYFEMQFTGLMKVLAQRPECVVLASEMPGSFDGKAKLFRKIARCAFPECPSLVAKLCEFATRSNQICKKRNALIHGFWFDTTVFEVGHGVTLTTRADGTGDYYSVTIDQIEALAVKISELRVEAIELVIQPIRDASARLTPEEVSAVRDYHRKFRAPPAAPIPPDPNRKGSPTQPEPFRA